ncbi:MAG: hypothetical protein AAF628_32595 [Planctomycetota bacterium]
MHRLCLVASSLLAFAVAPNLGAQKVCSRSSAGLTPLTDLGAGTYLGQDGGLYGGGQNQPPAAHTAAGVAAGAAIQPLDAAGQPAAGGTIGVLSIGMSNTSQEFSTWVDFSDLDRERAAPVVVVDGAQSGMDAARWVSPTGRPWSVAGQRLAAAGVSAAQVQAVFVKQALALPSSLLFPAHKDELATALVAIVQNVQAMYPNVRQCFFTSRIYGGYSPRAERTEPLSYETGFSVRDVVLRQIAGDPALNFDPSQGPVRAPWLAWGPYIWADGLTPRADGLTWRCDDFAQDGIHPSRAGRLQVSDMIDAYFRTSSFTPWYLGPARPAAAGILVYGTPCLGASGRATETPNGLPTLGNAGYALAASRLPGGAAAAILIGTDRTRSPLARNCNLWVGLAGMVSIGHVTSGSGGATQSLPIPNDPTLDGARVYTQWLAPDAGGTVVPGIGGLGMTPGQLHQLGT